MLPVPSKYTVYPSVVKADEDNEIIIAPAARAFLLFDGEEYSITLASVNPHSSDKMSRLTTLTVTAKEGILRFTHCFSGEQEHRLIISKDEKKLCEYAIYSLRPDLYQARAMRGDLHAHSFRSDGAEDPASLFGHYREQGYDFLALTDHNRFFSGEEIDEVYKDIKCGIIRIKGEEVHTPKSAVHIVHIGGSKGVSNYYIHNREEYEKEIVEYEKRVPSEIPSVHVNRYARAMWATDKIHAVGGLAFSRTPIGELAITSFT